MYSNDRSIFHAEDEKMIRVGAVIRQARHAKGLTQTDLAKLARMSQSNIAYLERDTFNPGIQTVNRVAKALGMSLTLLVAQAECLPDKDTADSA